MFMNAALGGRVHEHGRLMFMEHGQLMKRTPEVSSARAEPLFFASAEAGLAALPGL